MDHSTAISKAFREDASLLADMASLLGPSYRFPRAGVIRPGIMAPKKSCSTADVKKYETMVSQGLSWDEIEKEIGRGKLIPRNVDYFTIHPEDCVNPENAARIHELYADDDGRLRSFPVVFPVNEWWNIIPHSLRCFGANGLKFKSDFKFIRDTNGKVVDAERVCRFPEDTDPGKKVFGGRKWGERPCDPNVCMEYQKGECDFGGVIQFLIPGVPGMGVWVLPTTSWYSLAGVKDALALFSSVTGGRISGAFGKNTGIFRIRKKKTRISRLDPKSGKSVRTEQWLITLDADVDLTQLVASYENNHRALEASGRAAAMLCGDMSGNADASRNNPDSSNSVPVIETSAEIKARDKAVTESADEPDEKKTGDNEAVSSDSPDVDSKTSSGNDEADGKKKEKPDKPKKELSPSAKTLWKTISELASTNTERKKILRKVAGVDSFYDLDEERARKGLERISTEMLSGY